MIFRILGILATALLIGCGSDASPAVETGDGGFDPADGLPGDGPSEDSTASPDTAATDDGGGDTGAVGETSPPSDTGADAPVGSVGIKCGAVTCDAKTEECCSVGGVGACTTKGGACAGTRYACTSVDTCGSGQICCVSGAGTGGASCTATASCPTSHTCKTNADCSGKLKTCIDVGFIKICSA